MELYPTELSIPSYVSNYRTVMMKLLHQTPSEHPEEKLIVPFSEVHRVFHDRNIIDVSPSLVQAFYSNYSEMLYASVKMVDFQRSIWWTLHKLKKKQDAQNEALSKFMSNTVFRFLNWFSTSRNGETDAIKSLDNQSLFSRLCGKIYLMICMRFGIFGVQDIIDREKEISKLTEKLVHLYGKVKKDLVRLNYLTEPFIKRSTLEENRGLMRFMVDRGLIDLLSSAKETVSYTYEHLSLAMEQLTLLPYNFEIPVD